MVIKRAKKVQSKSNGDNNKYLKYAFYTLMLIVIITLIGANDFNLNIESELLEVKGSDLFTDNFAKIPIKILHINNNYFLPRSYVVLRETACLTKSGTKKSTNLGIMIDDKEMYQADSAVEISSYKTKDIKFYLNNLLPRKAQEPRIVADKSVIDVNLPTQEVDTDYDTILLIKSKTSRDYIDCYSLSDEQINNAEKVNII